MKGYGVNEDKSRGLGFSTEIRNARRAIRLKVAGK